MSTPPDAGLGGKPRSARETEEGLKLEDAAEDAAEGAADDAAEGAVEDGAKDGAGGKAVEEGGLTAERRSSKNSGNPEDVLTTPELLPDALGAGEKVELPSWYVIPRKVAAPRPLRPLTEFRKLAYVKLADHDLIQWDRETDSFFWLNRELGPETAEAVRSEAESAGSKLSSTSSGTSAGTTAGEEPCEEKNEGTAVGIPKPGPKPGPSSSTASAVGVQVERPLIYRVALDKETSAWVRRKMVALDGAEKKRIRDTTQSSLDLLATLEPPSRRDETCLSKTATKKLQKSRGKCFRADVHDYAADLAKLSVAEKKELLELRLDATRQRRIDLPAADEVVPSEISSLLEPVHSRSPSLKKRIR